MRYRRKTIHKVAISERALVQRMNRKLRHDKQKLFTARFLRDGEVRCQNSDLGRYYVVDTKQNIVVRSHVNLENEARQAGVLRGWERVRV